MKTVTLMHGTLSLSLPESFREMSREEIASLLAPDAQGDGLCLRSDELHAVVSIGWKELRGAGALLTRVLSGRDLAKNIRVHLEQSMRPFSFTAEDELTRTVGGECAFGLRYAYRAQETDMTGESLVLRRGDTLCYFHVYYRTQSSEESRRMWNAVLDSAVWSGR